MEKVSWEDKKTNGEILTLVGEERERGGEGESLGAIIDEEEKRTE
jgi:hypothetical protein